MAQQSNLERLGIDERNRELINNEYSKNNEYSENNPDALGPNSPNASGEEKGKGTGTSLGYLALTPNKDPHSPINYGTVITDRGGSAVDINVRNLHFNRNLYSDENEYGINSIDTSKNIADGQYVVR